MLHFKTTSGVCYCENGKITELKAEYIGHSISMPLQP